MKIAYEETIAIWAVTVTIILLFFIAFFVGHITTDVANRDYHKCPTCGTMVLKP